MARRLAVANRVAKPFRRLPQVLAICTCGSVALGLADDESDIDLAFLCAARAPGVDERRKRYAQLADAGKDIELNALGANTFDSLTVDGFQVEINFHILEKLRRQIACAMETTSLGRAVSSSAPGVLGRFAYMVLSDIQYWHILFERDRAATGLKHQVVYPESLRRTILQQGRFWSDPHILYEHERACRRRDVFYALQCQRKLADHFLQTVFALNRTYCPGDNWLLQFMRKFKQVPANFGPRFQAFLSSANDASGLRRKNELAHHLFRELHEMVKLDLASEK
jgi:predicted nucleotidyltransferase